MTPESQLSSALMQMLDGLEKAGLVRINREWLQRKTTGEPARKEGE